MLEKIKKFFEIPEEDAEEFYEECEEELDTLEYLKYGSIFDVVSGAVTALVAMLLLMHMAGVF